MKYRALGKTGIKVSSYRLGTMMFGKGGNPDHAIVHVELRRLRAAERAAV